MNEALEINHERGLMKSDLHLIVQSSPSEAEIRFIHDRLVEYNSESGYMSDPRQILFSLRDGTGEVVGGAACIMFWDWVYVSLLWIEAKHRKHGWGTRIMEKVEAYAVENKCIGVFLDTVDFQAPEFYKKLGYEIFGTLEDMPRGQTRYYYRKRVDTNNL